VHRFSAVLHTSNRALRRLARPLAGSVTRRWPARSRLFLVGEGAGWSIDHDLQELARIATRIGVRLADRRLLSASRDQAAFFGSQFTLLREWRPRRHALATAYFHGRPGTRGMPEFDEAYRVLRAHHEEVARIQVTHGEMHELVLSTGIDPAKVFRIPIGVDVGIFRPQTPASRAAARTRLGLPRDAFVVGSFQKDGVGMGDGNEPKTIKGPDVLVEALDAARGELGELVVLLTGPARGYVRRELERRGIAHVHRLLPSRDGLTAAYHALDAYLVASRQEGGPKSILESMATGVPLVTTKAGQAPDLVVDGRNGLLVDVDDAAGLASGLGRLHGDSRLVAALREAGRSTAEENSHERLAPRWAALLDGFAERHG